MRIALGTLNKRKKETTIKIFKELQPDEAIVVITHPSRSLVSDTPWDSETYQGAKNRAFECMKVLKEIDYAVGLESGLVERYGSIYEEAWACVLTSSGQEFFGYSSGLKVPDFITQKMKEEALPHYKVMDILDQEAKRIDNDDTWGTYSNNFIIRDVSLHEALRNALVQIFSPKESYYHKKHT